MKNVVEDAGGKEKGRELHHYRYPTNVLALLVILPHNSFITMYDFILLGSILFCLRSSFTQVITEYVVYIMDLLHPPCCDEGMMINNRNTLIAVSKQ